LRDFDVADFIQVDGYLRKGVRVSLSLVIDLVEFRIILAIHHAQQTLNELSR
jgi:hypothetical protein